MNKEKKSILIIGNSEKFITHFKKYFHVKVIPWRKCLLTDFDQVNLVKYEFVLLSGFDYSCYKQSFDLALDVNVVNPLRMLNKIDSTSIIYVNTEKPVKSYTWSRYLYLKNRLNNELINTKKNITSISVPTIIDNQKKPLINGGIFSKIIFFILIKANFVKTITFDELIQLIEIRQPQKLKEKIIKPYFLKIPRNQFLDRLLRIILG